MYEPEDFYLWLDKQSTGALACHIENRHRFPDLFSKRARLHVDRRIGVVESQGRCRRCRTEITQLWGLDDEWNLGLPGKTPVYVHPPGYLFGHLLSPEQRRLVKKEYRTRLLNGETEDDDSA